MPYRLLSLSARSWLRPQWPIPLSPRACPLRSLHSKMRIAVQGCGHGELNEIYASVEKSCQIKGWDGVDLLIIGGDFKVGMNLLLA